MDIDSLDINDLKSKAYDLITNIQILQNQLSQVNSIIAQKLHKERDMDLEKQKKNLKKNDKSKE